MALQIDRGSSYFFSANISVGGCSTSTMSGQYCNQTVTFLTCSQSENFNFTGNLSDAKSYNQSTQNVVSCRNSLQDSCHGDGEPKVYSLDVVGIAEQVTIFATDVRFNGTPSINNGANVSAIALMCYARYGAISLPTLHDYSGDINISPLVIRLPKVGRWYITILPANISKEIGEVQNISTKACYSMVWQVLQCPVGKAGLDCTLEKYTLQVGLLLSVFSISLLFVLWQRNR